MIPQADTSPNCPNCGSRMDIASNTGTKQIDCGVCGSTFSLPGHLCPKCWTYNIEETGRCENCGSALIRICRNCHSVNWSGNRVCVMCDEVMEELELPVGPSGETTTERLNRQMQQAKTIKALEEQASIKRMAELMAIEEARQAEIRQRITRQKEQEQRLLAVVFAAVALFLLGLIVYAIIISLN